jgi:hypothetical protein
MGCKYSKKPRFQQFFRSHPQISKYFARRSLVSIQYFILLSNLPTNPHPMKGHFKRGKLSTDITNKGFEPDVTYDCFYNGSGQLVVHHSSGAMAIVEKKMVEGTFNATPTTLFKITSNS